jgi:hypothetical protein
VYEICITEVRFEDLAMDHSKSKVSKSSEKDPRRGGEHLSREQPSLPLLSTGRGPSAIASWLR